MPGVVVNHEGSVYSINDSEQVQEHLRRIRIVIDQQQRKLAKVQHLERRLRQAAVEIAAIEAAGKGRRPARKVRETT